LESFGIEQFGAATRKDLIQLLANKVEVFVLLGCCANGRVKIDVLHRTHL